MTAMKDLAGKVAVVTGGASGIGKGIAKRLKAQGMQVVIADIEPGPLEATAAELGVTGLPVDVTDYDAVEALAAETVRRFGAVHLICNNAGVGSTAKIADMSLQDWRWILRVNLWGVINGVKAFLPRLLANPDGGHIVNTASMSGFTPLATLGGYTTSKYAVVGLSETLALELEQDGAKVGVTVLCPGPVRSNIKASSRNRPAALAGGALTDSDIEKDPIAAQMRWLDPDQVGDIVVRAIKRGDLYALTHPEMAPQVAARFEAIAEAFRAAAAADDE
jgi:NAD(P)-dependent dehydrogenase (short-subunit alcohol dehydrogenase family)